MAPQGPLDKVRELPARYSRSVHRSLYISTKVLGSALWQAELAPVTRYLGTTVRGGLISDGEPFK
jgi:hypothetical protein